MTMESALNEIRGLYANASAAGRQKMQEQLRGLQDELYTDWEVLFGLVMGVGRIKLSLSRLVTLFVIATSLGPCADRYRSQHLHDTRFNIQRNYP
jgi:hypothetical protein